MASISDIGWSSYRDYEGPFYRGKSGFRLPETPTETDKILRVITATEGGTWDAYNGYDRCICTSGLIQWCEGGQFSVSDMLGAAAKVDRGLIKSVDAQAASAGLAFKPNARGRYRFFFDDSRGEVDRREEQQQMFLKDSTGKRGTWDDASKQYAKQWAAAISTVWEEPAAQRIQADFTTARLRGFALKFARGVLDSAPDTNVGRAFKAAYISFAANNPTWANRHLEIAMNASTKPAFSIDWLIAVLKELTFGPKISIYPHRYDGIRPVLERLYGIDLPDMASELRQWSEATGMSEILSVEEIQQALIRLGFDLGPWGADGKFGNKTRDAVISFQQLHGLAPTGEIDPPTLEALLVQRDAGESITEELKRRVQNEVALSIARLARESVTASRREAAERPVEN